MDDKRRTAIRQRTAESWLGMRELQQQGSTQETFKGRIRLAGGLATGCYVSRHNTCYRTLHQVMGAGCLGRRFQSSRQSPNNRHAQCLTSAPSAVAASLIEPPLPTKSKLPDWRVARWSDPSPRPLTSFSVPG